MSQFVRIYQDGAGQWRNSLVAGNGEVIAQGEAHGRKDDAIRAAKRAYGGDLEVRVDEE